MSEAAAFAGVGVLVTGASRGLGRTVAESFAAEQARVGIGYRTRRGEAEETLKLVEAAGGTGALLQFDVRDLSAVKHAVEEFERGGSLDVLVNNAGIVSDQFFATLDAGEWNRVVDTNLTGTFHCCRAVVPSMMVRKQGSIINVTSITAIRASPGQANYAAAKAGVVGLTTTLAVELAPSGIRVNAVIPGLFSTGMGTRLDRRMADRHQAAIPLARFGESAELAAAIKFLASPNASYIVGHCLVVDGGLSL